MDRLFSMLQVVNGVKSDWDPVLSGALRHRSSSFVVLSVHK